MSLSPDEVDRLLSQLIDQTLPERPSDAEAEAVVRWGESVRIENQMLEMVLSGEATVRVGSDGVARYQLTKSGMNHVEELLRTSPSARELHDRLVAGDRPLTKGPDDPQ